MLFRRRFCRNIHKNIEWELQRYSSDWFFSLYHTMLSLSCQDILAFRLRFIYVLHYIKKKKKNLRCNDFLAGWIEWVDDVMPGRDVLRILRISKRQVVEFLLLKRAAKFFSDLKSRSLWVSTGRDLKHHKMHRARGRGQHSMVSIGF